MDEIILHGLMVIVISGCCFIFYALLNSITKILFDISIPVVICVVLGLICSLTYLGLTTEFFKTFLPIIFPILVGFILIFILIVLPVILGIGLVRLYKEMEYRPRNIEHERLGLASSLTISILICIFFYGSIENYIRENSIRFGYTKLQQNKESTENKSPDKIIKAEEKSKKEKKVEESIKKRQELQNLKIKLTDKAKRLKNTQEYFEKNILQFVTSIKKLQKEVKAENFAEIKNNKAIVNYLMAIQKAEAYEKIIERELQAIKLADLECNRIITSVDLDLIILENFDEELLDELITEIDKVINEVQPSTNELVLTDANTTLTPLDKIWEQFIN